MRRSVLAPSRDELTSLIYSALGPAAGRTFQASGRYVPGGLVRAEIDESAWYPATRLSGNPGRRGSRINDKRGSAEDRRRRKVYLLNTYGDGYTVKCSHCPTVLTFSTMCVDRHPVPGRKGGRYTRDNIRPSCERCSCEEGGRAAHGRPRKVAS